MNCQVIDDASKQREKLIVSLLLRVLSDDTGLGWPAVVLKQKTLPDGDTKTLIDQIGNIRNDQSLTAVVQAFQGFISTYAGTTYVPPECCGTQTAEALLPINEITNARLLIAIADYKE
jgi:hypothetical protein